MNYFPFYADVVQSVRALDDKRVRRSYILGVNTLRDLGAKRTLWLQGDTRAWFIEWVRELGTEIDHRWARLDSYEARAIWRSLPFNLQSTPLREGLQLVNNAKSCAVATRPADFTHLEVHEAYRRYIAFRWANIDVYAPKWTGREKPSFAPPPRL